MTGPDDSGNGTTSNPVADGGSILVHHQWVFDFNDDVFSGFAFGEFLLRNDGVLFIRYGSGSSPSAFSSWKVDDRWRGTSIIEFGGWAAGHSYGLSPPSGFPIDARDSED
jgi:hypothetical protein